MSLFVNSHEVEPVPVSYVSGAFVNVGVTPGVLPSVTINELHDSFSPEPVSV